MSRYTKACFVAITLAVLALVGLDPRTVALADTLIRGSQIKSGTVTSTQLSSTGVTAATYGDATHVGTFTVDAAGRLTAASNTSIAVGTVNPTGSPASGNLTKFSGATTITNADLTGDVTTSGTVATTIANDAVTYAKMQNVSAASTLIGRGDSGSGDPQEITLGSGLSMTGTTLSASGGGGGSGALVLVEQHTASSSSSLDFTTCISSTYDTYNFEFVSIVPATNNVDLRMTVSTNGGSSYDSSTNYTRSFQYGAGNNSTAGGGATGQTFWDIGGAETNSATGGLSGRMTFYNPLSTSSYKLVMGILSWMHTTVDLIGVQFSLIWKSTTAVNAVRFAMDSGNIASGTIRCYGITK